MTPQILSGARLKVSINGEVIAAGFVADYRIETRFDEIEGLDTVFPVELAPSKVKVNLSLRVYRTPDNDAVATGYAPGSGNLGSTEQKSFSQSSYVFIEIKDNNDQTIIYIPKFVIETRSGSVSVGDFLTETWSGRGIGYRGPAAG